MEGATAAVAGTARVPQEEEWNAQGNAQPYTCITINYVYVHTCMYIYMDNYEYTTNRGRKGANMTIDNSRKGYMCTHVHAVDC